MRTSIIYCHKNKITGKSYIGWTVKSIEKRWAEHCAASLHDCHTLFANALRKWGLSDDVWEHEIIESHLVSFSVAKEAERFWIADRNTNFFRSGHGYNMTDGGDGVDGHRHTEASKEKMRKPHPSIQGSKHPMFGQPGAMRGKSHKNSSKELMKQKATERFSFNEERQKVSGAKNGMFGKSGESHPAFGKKRSQQTKKLQSFSQLKRFEDETEKLSGSKNGRAKLDEARVYQIKMLLPSKTNVELATMFNVSYSIIAKIRKELTWKHVILNKQPV